MPGTLLPPELPTGPRSALVIATGTYDDEQFAQLRAPARDADDLAAVLSDPRIGGFEVTVLPDRPVDTLRREIEGFLADRTRGELLVVYLSCHGVLDKRNALYFAATDTSKKFLASTGIESHWLLERLDECKARQQVLILDCCFSGAFANGAKGEGDLDLKQHVVGSGRGRMVLTASRAREYSFEGHELPGIESPGSVFTSGLAEGLRSGAADSDLDGLVSVEDAYDYAYTYVQTHHPAQTPQRWAFGAEGRIWLARNPFVGDRSKQPEMAQDGPVRATPPISTQTELTQPRHARPPTTPPQPTQSPLVLPTVQAAEPEPSVQGSSRRGVLVAAAGLGGVGVLGTSAWFLTRSTGSALPPSASSTGRSSTPPPSSNAAVALGRPLQAGNGDFCTAAFSADGKLLAVGSNSGTAAFIGSIHLWDVSQPTAPKLLGSPLSAVTNVNSVTLSADGHILAAGCSNTEGANSYLQVWNIENPAKPVSLGDPTTTDYTHACAVEFAPRGSLLAAASGSSVKLLDATASDNPTTVGLTENVSALVNALAFAPSGKLLAAGFGTLAKIGTVQLWDVSDASSPIAVGDPLPTPVSNGLAYLTGVAFSPDGRLLAGLNADEGTVLLWNVSNPETPIARAEPLTGTYDMQGIAFSHDGKMLAVGTAGGVLLWNVANPAALKSLGRLATDHAVLGFAFSPDGKTVVSTGIDTVQLWQIRTS